MRRIESFKFFICATLIGLLICQVSAQSESVDLETGMNEKVVGIGVATTSPRIRDLVDSGYCIQPPYNHLCAELPHDVLDFDASFVYRFLEKNAQTPFDIFSWQTFIALNWPSTNNGQPLNQSIGSIPKAKRVWQSYVTPSEIFSPNEDDACADIGNDSLIFKPKSLMQSVGLPLIDKNLNFVVFDTRMNQKVADYITANGLDTLRGQLEFKQSGKDIFFPQGFFENNETRSGGADGSIVVKSAWKVITRSNDDDENKYYRVTGYIAIPENLSHTGRAFCVQAQLGLIGMHVIHRTTNGNGGDWIWTTFEHVDVAPLADNARRPNNIFAKQLFPEGCKAPQNVEAKYALFDSQCDDCTTNAKPPANWKWASNTPYAKLDSLYQGAQVVRCWEIFESTQYINVLWQQKLADTVWANYQLLSTQWKGARKGDYFPAGEVPRFLTNATMETFEQGIHNGSCLGCHSQAKSAVGQDSNFSFLLTKVSKE